MANELQRFFNYYKRYKWKADDFTQLQDTLKSMVRDSFDASFGGSVFLGGEVTPVSGTTVQVAPFVAVGPSGYLMVKNSSTNVVLPSAHATNPNRHRIVARPSLTQSTAIARPTNPFDTVYLHEDDLCQVIAVTGTASASALDYPSAATGDVTFAGVRVLPAITNLTADDIDTNIKDTPGESGAVMALIGHTDLRLKARRSGATTLTIKPSQTVSPHPRLFTMNRRGAPCVFPKDVSGYFNASDTVVDMATGTVTGGDGSTPDFTPSVPAAGMFKVASIYVKDDSTLSVVYGQDGTFSQCMDGIVNARMSGAGSVALRGWLPVCHVITASSTGSSITGIDVIDARAFAGLGGSDYDAIVGSLPYCTHATLEEVMSDSSISTGARILVVSDRSVSSPIVITKPEIKIDHKSGVTYTKSGASACFSVAASGVTIQNGRITNFNGVSDVGIIFSTNGSWGNVVGTRFKSCTTEFDTSACTGNVNVYGTHSEV